MRKYSGSATLAHDLDLVVGVAQLVRAPGCGPGGRGFNSHHSPQKKKWHTEKLQSGVVPDAGPLELFSARSACARMVEIGMRDI